MILQGDCREVLATLPAESIQTCVTSPPYFGLRDYGVEGQIGLEPMHDCLAWTRGGPPCGECYVCTLRKVFAAVHRVLRPDGTLWLNLGDSYVSVGSGTQGADGQMATRRVAQVRDRKAIHATVERPPSIPGLAPKNLIGIPWRVAFALQADGWWLRSDCIWSKPNPMPESVTDRPTKAHEYVFLLSKSERYFYDAEAIREEAVIGDGGRQRAAARGASAPRLKDRSGGHLTPHTGLDATALVTQRNARSVWTINTKPFPEAHFAVFPPEIPRRCILAGSRPGDTVLDPFNGSGTTGYVAQEHGRRYVGIELNPEYIEIAERRTAQKTIWQQDGAA